MQTRSGDLQEQSTTPREEQTPLKTPLPSMMVRPKKVNWASVIEQDLSSSKEKTAAQTSTDQPQTRKRELKELDKKTSALRTMTNRVQNKTHDMELNVTQDQSDPGHEIAQNTIQSSAGQTSATGSQHRKQVETDATARKTAKSSSKVSQSELIAMYRAEKDEKKRSDLLSKIPNAQHCEQLIKVARQKPGLEHYPALFSSLMNCCKPRLPQSQLAPWSLKTPHPVLGPSKSLVDGGVIAFDGKWETLEDMEGYTFQEKSFGRLCQETLAVHFKDQVVTQRLKEHKVKEMILVDAALAKYCCHKPCGAHYYCMQYFYWNYVKSYSQRGITSREFPTWKDLQRHQENQYKLLETMAAQDNEGVDIDYDKQEQLQTDCRLMQKASDQCVYNAEEDSEVAIAKFDIQTQGPNGVTESSIHFPSFYGVPFRHPSIHQDPQVSGCCDTTRKNRTCSELAVSINQAFCVYTDMELLQHGIPTTNDLVNIVRDHYPAMFESIFEKVYSVAQSYPFTLDAEFIAGKRLSVVGQLNTENKLSQLKGHLELRRVILHKDAQDQDLTIFVEAINRYLENVVRSVRQELKQVKAARDQADNQKEISRLENVIQTLKDMSPLIQVDYVDIKNLQKFSFVTNVRRDASGKLLIREPNQSAALIQPDDVQKAMQDLPDAHKQPDLDRLLASKSLSKGKLSHSQYYQPWGKVPAAQKNPMIVKLGQTDALKDAQKEIANKLGQFSDYNKHLAVLLGNHFNPTSLGFKVSDPQAVQNSISRMKRLSVESAALYMVEFVPEQVQEAGKEYWKSLAFYLKGCYRMNEFIKHADFMSDSRYLSHCYQYLMEDVLGQTPYKERFPDHSSFHIRGADLLPDKPLTRVRALWAETANPKILTVSKALNMLGSVMKLEENRLQLIKNASAKKTLEQVSEYMLVDRQSKPVRIAGAGHTDFSSQKEDYDVRQSTVTVRHNSENNRITIDLEAPIDLAIDDVQHRNLQQGLTLTLQAIDTIQQKKIKETSFEQVIAAYANAYSRQNMNPSQKELSNLLQNYLNCSEKVDDAGLVVEYLEDVYKTNQISFEVFAFDKNLNIAESSELKVKNSLLPADNLILLSTQRYDYFSSSNDTNRPYSLRIRNQKQFFAVFHHCQLFILAWLTKHGLPYDREKFLTVIVDSLFAWRNFLAGAGITLKLPAGQGGLVGMHLALQYRKDKQSLTECIWTKFVDKSRVRKTQLTRWQLTNELVVDTEVKTMTETMVPYLQQVLDESDTLRAHNSAIMKLINNYKGESSDESAEEEVEEHSGPSKKGTKDQRGQNQQSGTMRPSKPAKLKSRDTGTDIEQSAKEQHTADRSEQTSNLIRQVRSVTSKSRFNANV